MREIIAWETGANAHEPINQQSTKASALAGVESEQPNPTQRREAVKGLPQRHSMPSVNRAERLALLKAQAAEVMARAKAMQVHT